ncbi:hypothetical protein D3C85_1714000 [compost metagenome]
MGGESEIAGNSVISCDIQTLSALFMGYLRASLLHQLGRIEGHSEEIARLELRLPSRTTYLADYF